MSSELVRVEKVEDLPSEWDHLAQSTFQRTAFLSHCQMYNPCNQRYYLLSQGNTLVAGAVVYTLPIDLLTFWGIRSPVKMHIAGIPCSVSSPGLVGNPRFYPELLDRIASIEKGLFLCLNLDEPPEGSEIVGHTWPTVALRNPFSCWEEYRRSLRSHYAKRLLKIERLEKELTIRTGCCRDGFSKAHYPLYEAVHQRSKGKLEKLNGDFFCNLPPEFTLTTISYLDRMYGWTLSVRDNDRYYFFLGGQDYGFDPIGIYHVKLMTIIKQGIAGGATHIDLGQSAEIPKMRFGGEIREKYLVAYHSNGIIRKALSLGRRLLTYNQRFPQTHCFVEPSPC